jgi:hypothetical protein
MAPPPLGPMMVHWSLRAAAALEAGESVTPPVNMRDAPASAITRSLLISDFFRLSVCFYFHNLVSITFFSLPS